MNWQRVVAQWPILFNRPRLGSSCYYIPESAMGNQIQSSEIRLLWGTHLPPSEKILIDSATPEDCVAILLSIRGGVSVSQADVEAKARGRGTVADASLFRNVNRLVDLSILQRTKTKDVQLTEFGTKCKNLLLDRPILFYELMHHIHMSSAFEPEKKRYFRTYYLISKYLYENHRVSNPSHVISNVLSDLELIFGESQASSIDATSVSKVVSWLKMLEPKFVLDDGKRFQGRANVTQETAMMAITGYYRQRGLEYGTPIMLDKQTVRGISLMGLIDESDLLKNLQQLSVRFPTLALLGTVEGKGLLLRDMFTIDVIV